MVSMKEEETVVKFFIWT